MLNIFQCCKFTLNRAWNTHKHTLCEAKPSVYGWHGQTRGECWDGQARGSCDDMGTGHLWSHDLITSQRPIRPFCGLSQRKKTVSHPHRSWFSSGKLRPVGRERDWEKFRDITDHDHLQHWFSTAELQPKNGSHVYFHTKDLGPYHTPSTMRQRT